MGGGKFCLCLCVYLREWCVLAHRVFLTGSFALYKSPPSIIQAADRQVDSDGRKQLNSDSMTSRPENCEVVVVALASLAQILGEGSTIQSPPSVVVVLVKWNLARAH